APLGRRCANAFGTAVRSAVRPGGSTVPYVETCRPLGRVARDRPALGIPGHRAALGAASDGPAVNAARDGPTLDRARDRLPFDRTGDVATRAVPPMHGAFAHVPDDSIRARAVTLPRLPDVNVVLVTYDIDVDRMTHEERRVIVMPVERVMRMQMMVDMHVVRVPADHERRRDAEEKAEMEMVVRRIRVVIDRIRPRVVVNRHVVMHDDMPRLVVRHVDDLGIRRPYADRVVALVDDEPIVALEVARFARG